MTLKLDIMRNNNYPLITPIRKTSLLFLFLFNLHLNYAQDLILDAGRDLQITCFDEVQLNARLINWRHSAIYDAGLFSLFYLNDSVGFACGGRYDLGIVLKTTDRGSNWTMLKVPVNTGLSRIYFLNEDTGFITSGGYISKTIDGGQHWKNYVSFPMNAIEFINDSVGYAVGAGIVKTNDAGETWEPLLCPIYSYYDINFIDSLHGLVVGRKDEAGYYDGKLLLTYDGGKTWHEKQLRFAFSLNKISHIRNRIFVVTLEGMIITSDDFFETWEIHQTGTLSELLGIDFLNPDTGVIVGRNGTILTTIDGAKSWSREFTDYSGDLYTVKLLSDSIRQIVGSNPGALDGGSVIHYRKIPKGFHASWEPPIYLSDPTQLSPVLYPLESTEYHLRVTDSVNIVLQDTLMVSVSTPGIYAGADFEIEPGERVSLSAATEEGTIETVSRESRSWFEDVVFVSKDTGFIVGSQIGGVLLKTTDGGETWCNKITNKNLGFYEVTFPNSHVGYVAGVNGNIYKTINGGETWDSINSTTKEVLYSICFVNSELGYVAGENGVLLKTTNGGATWQHQSTASGFTIKKLYFVNEKKGFATGIFPWECAFYETGDGGEKWTKRIIPGLAFDITDIQFLNDSVGFMVGGTLTHLGFMRTRDGGKTWDANYFVREFMTDYSSLFFTDEYIGYVCTGAGEIVKTFDGGDSWYIGNKFSDASLKSIAFRDENNAITVGSSGFIGRYHESSDIHYVWSPRKEISLAMSQHPIVYPLNTTTYKVSAYNKAGCITSDFIQVAVINVTNSEIKLSYEKSDLIEVFPNPSSGYVYLRFKNSSAEKVHIVIRDIDGKVYYEREIPLEYERDLPIVHNLRAGIYFIEISYEGRKVLKKMIVS
jgi:photosystem II stability/assembly factor-like uncharacterized protein